MADNHLENRKLGGQIVLAEIAVQKETILHNLERFYRRGGQKFFSWTHAMAGQMVIISALPFTMSLDRDFQFQSLTNIH